MGAYLYTPSYYVGCNIYVRRKLLKLASLSILVIGNIIIDVAMGLHGLLTYTFKSVVGLPKDMSFGSLPT